MKTNQLRMIAALMAPAMLSLSTAQAAEPVQWNDLPQKIGRGKVRPDGHQDRQYRVVTKDGKVHTGYALAFTASDLKVSPTEPAVPREQVSEIRIHRQVRLSDALKAPGGAVFNSLCGKDGTGCILLWPLVPLFIPVAMGITAGAAPIVLPIEGIHRLIPDKVIQVAP